MRRVSLAAFLLLAGLSPALAHPHVWIDTKIEILLKKDVKPGSRVLLSFGEIDCRIHMDRG